MSILRARASDPDFSTIQTIHDTTYGSAGDPRETGRAAVPTGPGAAEWVRAPVGAGGVALLIGGVHDRQVRVEDLRAGLRADPESGPEGGRWGRASFILS